MVNFARMLQWCKVDGEALLGRRRVHRVCRQVDHRWRDGKLPPATAVLGMMQQVAHANVSCAAVRQMHGGDPEARVRNHQVDIRVAPAAADQDTSVGGIANRVCDQVSQDALEQQRV